MSPVSVEITAAAGTDASEDISFIADVDSLSSGTVMLACGEDNPYH
jgi:hypothetical protein